MSSFFIKYLYLYRLLHLLYHLINLLYLKSYFFIKYLIYPLVYLKSPFLIQYLIYPFIHLLDIISSFFIQNLLFLISHISSYTVSISDELIIHTYHSFHITPYNSIFIHSLLCIYSYTPSSSEDFLLHKTSPLYISLLHPLLYLPDPFSYLLLQQFLRMNRAP